MSIRRLTITDRALVRDLRLRSLADAPEAFGSTHAREAAFTDDQWDARLGPDTNSHFAAFASDGAAVGLAAGVRDDVRPELGHLVGMWVDPAARGRGAADDLIVAVVAWAEAGGLRALRLHVVVGNDRAERLYERHGFHRTGKQVKRTRDGVVEFAMERPVLTATTIRPERGGSADEVAAIDAVVHAAFASRAEALLVERIRASEHYVPEWSLVAVRAGRVVGHVMVSRVGLRAADGTEREVCSLAPLAVSPGHHREGIGSALVRAVAARVEAAGEPLIVLEGDPAYYGRFGFEPSVARGITITLPEWASPEAAQVLPLGRYDPAVRGHVEYPPAFADLQDR